MKNELKDILLRNVRRNLSQEYIDQIFFLFTNFRTLFNFVIFQKMNITLIHRGKFINIITGETLPISLKRVYLEDLPENTIYIDLDNHYGWNTDLTVHRNITETTKELEENNNNLLFSPREYVYTIPKYKLIFLKLSNITRLVLERGANRENIEAIINLSLVPLGITKEVLDISEIEEELIISINQEYRSRWKQRLVDIFNNGIKPKYETELKRRQMELGEYISTLNMVQEKVDLATMRILNLDKEQEQFEKLFRVSTISDIEYIPNENSIKVTTTPLEMINYDKEYLDERAIPAIFRDSPDVLKWFKENPNYKVFIRPYYITLSLRDYSLRFTPVQNSNVNHHAQVGCKGTFGSTFNRVQTERKLIGSFLISLQYLQSMNINDSAGSSTFRYSIITNENNIVAFDFQQNTTLIKTEKTIEAYIAEWRK